MVVEGALTQSVQQTLGQIQTVSGDQIVVTRHSQNEHILGELMCVF
jgi:hypothetical protein